MDSNETEKKAKRLFELMTEIKPRQPRCYDTRGINPIWDFCFFCTVLSERQAEAIVAHVRKSASREKIKMHHCEQAPEGGWTLLDFGDMVIHVFTKEAREFYALEEFMQKAPSVDFGVKYEEV